MKKRFLFYAMSLVAMLSFGSCGDDVIEDVDNTPNKEQTESGGMCEEKCTSLGKTNGVEYVDLGLPSGNLWATMNIGANMIEQYGDLYSWGEISTKDDYRNFSYSFYKEGATVVDGWSSNYIEGYTKYVPEGSNWGYGGFFDNKTTLDLTDDVAHVKLGGSWRMPTKCDFDELLENCDIAWGNYHGVNGCKFTAKNGKWLFLPYAGFAYNGPRESNGSIGCYWSSSDAIRLFFNPYEIETGHGSRSDGCSVRAVCPSVKSGNGMKCWIDLISSPSVGGTVSGGGVYELGMVVVVEAKPYDGYAFVKWNDGDETNPRTITVTKDMSLCAYFEKPIEPIDKSLGILPGKFSVSPTKKVQFAMGNLQYQASTKTWRFAENQYDVIGEDNKNISATYEGWIDLFGYGTSGYKTMPYETSGEDSDYPEADIVGTNNDWGKYNAISNGGNEAGLWSTLTGDEMKYLLSERPNAEKLYTSAFVCNMPGYIFLPDDWKAPAGISMIVGDGGFCGNSYNPYQWSVLEQNGALFFPCAEFYEDVSLVDYYGNYWSGSNEKYHNHPYRLHFYVNMYGANVSVATYRRHDGASVRLARTATE